MRKAVFCAAAAASVASGGVGSDVLYVPFEAGRMTPFVSSASETYDQTIEVMAPTSPEGSAAGDVGVVLMQEARRYAITAPLPEAVSTSDDAPLVVQYEVKLQNGLSCGGAYVKVYEEGVAPAAVSPLSPYVIMFGPDRCGATDKVHLILRVKNPVTGETEEKHLQGAPRSKNDALSHLYTLVLTPEGGYKILIDSVVEKEGSLSTDFSPSIIPPREIDDATDFKPETWVDDAEIPDASAVKPEDWDEDAPMYVPDEEAQKPAGWLDGEAEQVADPAASKPADWSDEEDGEWEAPLVANAKCADAPGCGTWTRPTKRNPAYKGKWRAPLVPNPAFIGVWAPRKVPNPAFYEDAHLNRLSGARMGALGVEVWTMSGGMLFDDFLITRDPAAAEAIAAKTWAPKHTAQEAAQKAAADAAAASAAAAANSPVETAKRWLAAASELAQEQPLATAAAVLGGLAALALTAFAACGGSRSSDASKDVPKEASRRAPVVNAAGAEESDDDDAAEAAPAEQPADAPEEKPESSVRRRPTRKQA